MSKENNGWVSVKDRLPEKFKEVIVTNRYIFIAKFDGEDWIVSGGFFGIRPIYGVTHWQPLPEPPKED